MCFQHVNPSCLSYAREAPVGWKNYESQTWMKTTSRTFGHHKPTLIEYVWSGVTRQVTLHRHWLRLIYCLLQPSDVQESIWQSRLVTGCTKQQLIEDLTCLLHSLQGASLPSQWNRPGETCATASLLWPLSQSKLDICVMIEDYLRLKTSWTLPLLLSNC